jgi:hypothetical protein
MKNGFDMYNQTFEYTRLKHSPPKLSNRTMINHNIEDVKKFNLDYISIKDTNLEHVKEIHGYSVQKFENKVVFAEINIPLAKYKGNGKWDILKQEGSEVLANINILWESEIK